MTIVTSRFPSLSLADTVQLHVDEQLQDGALYLRVYGASMHSAYAISRVDVEEEGDTLLLLARVVSVFSNPPPTSLEGEFCHLLEVPAHVNTVHYGPFAETIWARSE